MIVGGDNRKSSLVNTHILYRRCVVCLYKEIIICDKKNNFHKLFVVVVDKREFCIAGQIDFVIMNKKKQKKKHKILYCCQLFVIKK